MPLSSTHTAPRHTGGVSFGGLTAPAESAEDRAAREASVAARDAALEAARAVVAKTDREIMVVLEGPAGLQVTTDLDTLCIKRGIGWCERNDIRATLAAGQAYRGDNAGWTKLTREFTVGAAARARKAA